MSGWSLFSSKLVKSQRIPIFNNYLFESVAILVKWACEKEPSLNISFWRKGFFFFFFCPFLQLILANDVTEFFPYAFQLLAQLVELNSPQFLQSTCKLLRVSCHLIGGRELQMSKPLCVSLTKRVGLARCIAYSAGLAHPLLQLNMGPMCSALSFSILNMV
jgi:hypothetical protein